MSGGVFFFSRMSANQKPGATVVPRSQRFLYPVMMSSGLWIPWMSRIRKGDCIYFSYNATLENSTITLRKEAKLSDSDQDMYEKQEECLGLKTPAFMDLKKELCPEKETTPRF
ncbi:hypothetical protein JZ751_016496 [Albula glossodonta]|uniref:Uncharacterized protein n=1 Tax=Albula glossodonta TaxID=121402 RepID=A0A8T2NNR8_9TELE|nr:hypothetical protein JZ751_016496 [Albula glossodonta]